jgi:hypothetical protein
VTEEWVAMSYKYSWVCICVCLYPCGWQYRERGRERERQRERFLFWQSWLVDSRLIVEGRDLLSKDEEKKVIGEEGSWHYKRGLNVHITQKI